MVVMCRRRSLAALAVAIAITSQAFAQDISPESVIREGKILVDETSKNIAGIRTLFTAPVLSEEKFITDLREQRAVSSRLFAKIRSLISRCDIAITQVKLTINQFNQQIANIDELSDDDRTQLNAQGAQDYFANALQNSNAALNEALTEQKDSQGKIDDMRKTAGFDVDSERGKYEEAVRVMSGVRPATSEMRQNAIATLGSINQNLRNLLDNLRAIDRKITSSRREIAKYQRINMLYKNANAQSLHLTTLNELVSGLQNGQSDLESEINKIDEKFVSKINDTRTRDYFTAGTTAIFGLAVIIVIVFFFRLANNDAARVALFQNDSGLQFVTLFSIVIAIILFGVLKVLEGKELAALLGGLSGYILGRGSISRQPGQNQAAVPPAPQGPPMGAANPPPAPAAG